METLDRFDHAILRELMRDGRQTATALASAVGLSKTPTLARMRRMERAGIIRGYTALVDPSVLDRAHVAFVEVRLDDTRERALQTFNEAARALPEIEACHMIAGAFDYLLKVRTRDVAAYRRTLGERISALPHVASTSTFVSMETVKDPVETADARLG
ncbi:Lrp/AsnC family transcriptional regulator [Jannaschia aquimarina]|uniref:Lrp_5 protein n=1 Tax=Jannaschia aquimarina TaxID=935700 RepID=A0A0D1EMG2_9RHOB|nr:Lrp/AsnC ligand binding domain-containing protein [Jannaschia aquimarina]KIT16870.1 Leucine-responsive regulatory protein [Jannaschia aquimarina]SNT12654.1 transcriptional regulator, AsnC family [Jannaschia aquimarina]